MLQPNNRPDNQADWIDEILKSFYNRVCSTAGTSFAGDPYKILSRSAKAAITTKIAEERIAELEWLLDPAHAHISTRERLKALKGDK